MLAAIVILLFSLCTAPQESATQEAAPASDAPRARLVQGSLRIPRGAQPELWIPDGERLSFRIELDMGLLGKSDVGEVSMSSGVEPFIAGLPLPGQTLTPSGQLVGWVNYTAHAAKLGLKIDNTLSTRFLPTRWPSLIHSEVQVGRKNRVREIKLGQRDQHWSSDYKPDEHCTGCERKEHFVVSSLPWSSEYHCKGCKRGEHRLPGAVRPREVPPQTLDILGTVYLARNLIRTGESHLTTLMVKKQQLWSMTFRTGKLKVIRVPAGEFNCQQVLLDVVRPAGEDPKGKDFSGLFGIRGVLSIWMHTETGVPVMIEGDVPAGSLIDLHVKIGLAKYTGTPELFQPLP